MKRTLALLLLVGMTLCTVALAAGELQLRTTVPGAYALRFWPDRVVVTYATEAAVAVTVKLPAAAKWAVLDDKPLAIGKVKWDAAAGVASVDLPTGDHTVVLGWAGSFLKPAEGQKIPVLLGGKQVGSLTCHFDLEKMTAEGAVTCPLGLYASALKTAVGGNLGKPTLVVGSTTVWEDGSAVADAHPMVAEATPFSLTIKSYGLATSPVKEIVLESMLTALTPKRLDKMPAQGLVIEAEDFAAEGLGQVQVSTKHFDLHGGKCVMSNSGDGHWLQYKFTLDKPGQYDLVMRAATQEPADLRSVRIDGQTPPGLGLIMFPGTGGWGYSASEWAALQVTGLDKAPSLKLEAGEHTLRVTGEGSTHLNFDYFMLVPRAD